MNFNWVYSERNVVIVLQKNKDLFINVDDLSEKNTFVVPNTSYHDWLLNFNLEHSQKIKINAVPAGGTLHYLLNGEADFVILSSAIVIYSKFHLNKKIEIAFPISPQNPSGWGFAKGDPGLLNLSKKFIEKQSNQKNSELNTIFKKYFGLTLKEFHELQEQTTP